MLKKTLLIILRIVISLFFIGLLLWMMRDNIEAVWRNLKTVKIPLFIWAFLLYVLAVLTVAYRLKRVLTVQEVHLSLFDVIRLTFIGLFFTNLMPTSVGGDVVKAYYTTKKTNKTLGSISAILMDRVFGLFSFILIATIAIIFLGRTIENKAIVWTICLMMAAAFTFLFLLLNKKTADKLHKLFSRLKFFKLDEKLKQLYGAISMYRHHKKIVLEALSLSIICQVLSVISIYLLAKSLSVTVPLGTLFLIVPIIVAVTLLPISLNGLGIREGAYVYFLGGIIGPEAAFALSVLWLGTFLAASFIGGIFYLFRKT